MVFLTLFAVTTTAVQSTVSHDDPSLTYNYVALADWGNDGPGQYAAAAGLAAVAKEIDAQQVFALGDNFYPHGIDSVAKDGVDGAIRFKKTYEDVYNQAELEKIPWYVIAGNHDHYGNVSAEIEYSTNPQNANGRWKFPNWYHNVTRNFVVGGKNVELEVLLFDSVIMTGNTGTLHANGTITEKPLNELKSENETLQQEQMDWLESRMSTSTADYLWLGGHFPVWAIGQDPPTGIRQILRDLLNKWEAQYFNGHEHDFEHIVENGTKVNYVSTGAGMFCCYEDRNLDTVPQNSIKFASSGKGGAEWWGGVPIPDFEILSGFTSYRIGADSMKVYYHAHNGTVLYVTDPILPRTKKPQPPAPPIEPFCSAETCPSKPRPSSSAPIM